jgi:serine/threonine protein phosphatase PrpC
MLKGGDESLSLSKSKVINKNTYSSSLIGKRKNNEDTEAIIINLENENDQLAQINFFGLFDGHGGNFVSLFLQKNLIKFFVNKKMEYPVKDDTVIKIYQYLNQTLDEKYKKQSLHTGSTALVVLEYYGSNNLKNLLVLNSGDCRAVLCKDNIAMPLTADHKPNWPYEKARIESLGGKIKFDGYDWRILDLSVCRAFGDFDNKYVTNLPDMYKYVISKFDKFIILACDGLWDVLTNQEVIHFILEECYDKTYKKRKIVNFNIAEKLAHYAINEKKSTDNVSIIIHFLD